MSEQSAGSADTLAIEILCRLADEIGCANGVAQIYDAALAALRDGLGLERSSILLCDADGRMRFEAWRGLSSAYRAAVDGQWPWRPETCDGVPIVVRDVRHERSLRSLLPAFEQEGITALLFVPLQMRGRVLGTFMGYADRPRDFSHRELSFARAVGQQVAFTVTRLATETECARLTAQAEFLAHVSLALNRTLNYRETLHALTELAVPRISDVCMLHVREGDRAVQAMAVADRHRERGRRLLAGFDTARDESDFPAVSRVLEGGQTLLLHRPPPRELGLGADVDDLDVRSAMIVPLRTSDGLVGVITFAAAAESGRAYDESDLALAEEVACRAAAAIDNARLYHIAQEANRQKDEFLATLSHELRTPLNAVLGWARLLEGGRLPPDRTSTAVVTIRRNAETQARLIADILDVARIISGKLQLDVGQVDVSRLVATAAYSCETEAQRRQLSLSTRIEPGIVATADPARLQQVVWNLLSNAMKFTPAGGRIEVTLRLEADGLLLQVSDTGCGIDASFLPHLFQRFRQADPSMTRSHTGLGLGLAIARHLTELHGGTIAADSPGPGSGSTFIVRLPGAAEFSATADEQRSRLPDSAARLVGRRLLVVDDDPDARQLLAVVLGDAGAQVVTAASAPEALAHLQRDGCDVLIADIAMPGQDGFELLQRVRALDGPPARVPAIAVTAHARDDDRRRTQLAGFQGHLAKPVDCDALFDMLAGALEPQTSSL